MDRDRNVQYAPYPHELEALVTKLRYRPGWRFGLSNIERDPEDTHGSAAGGLTFVVITQGYDAYHPENDQNYGVRHYFPVPAATYNERSWRRWLLECLLRVEQHEATEFFSLVPACTCRNATWSKPPEEDHLPECPSLEIVRPYAPTHGPGDDPYVVHEYASEQQRRTRFTGEVLVD